VGIVEFRLLRQVTDADAGLRTRLAVDVPVDAAMMRSNVDLPEPLRPSTPIFAPGKKERLMSRRITRLGGTTFETRFIV